MLTQLVYVLIGLVATAVIVVVGHSYWAWRRSRGDTLTSADEDIARLTHRSDAADRPQSRAVRSASPRV